VDLSLFAPRRFERGPGPARRGIDAE